MLVETPRMRNSASARRALSTAFSKVRPRQVSLASIESKWGADLGTGVGRAAVEAYPGPPGER